MKKLKKLLAVLLAALLIATLPPAAMMEEGDASAQIQAEAELLLKVYNSFDEERTVVREVPNARAILVIEDCQNGWFLVRLSRESDPAGYAWGKDLQAMSHVQYLLPEYGWVPPTETPAPESESAPIIIEETPAVEEPVVTDAPIEEAPAAPEAPAVEEPVVTKAPATPAPAVKAAVTVAPVAPTAAPSMRTITVVLREGEASLPMYKAQDGAELIAAIPSGTMLQVSEISAQWSLALYNGQYGYVETAKIALYNPDKVTEEEQKIIRSISITSSVDNVNVVREGDIVVLYARLVGFENDQYILQWQYSPDGGATVVNVSGANGTEYSFPISAENTHYMWRLHVEFIGENAD